MKKLNVLISAYACNPYLGSENQVGWNVVSRISKKHNVTVIVSSSNKNDIRSFNKKNHRYRKIKFIFINHKRFSLIEKIWAPSYYWSYKIWQKEAFIIARKLHKIKNFDLCHQLNMIGFREPGYLWKLNIPFVWGPIGGLTFYSSKLIFNFGLYNFFYSLGYNFLNYLDIKFSNRPRLAFNKKNKFILASNTDTQKQILKYFRQKSKILLPVASENKKEYFFKKKKNKYFNIFWGGVHVPRKALNLAIDTLSLLPNNLKWKLHITGKGRLTEKWKRYAAQKGLINNCIFYGFLKKRDDIYKIIKNCDVHLFTSIKEDTPSIIMETSCYGLPTVCLNLFGAKDLITNKSGIKVQVSHNHKDNISNLKKAILKIALNTNYRRKLSSEAKKFAKKMSWDRNISIINDTYIKSVIKKK